jgi:ABC-type bacteriocin/lantibiotic exporter with double-glycine peptidase domain
VAENVRLARPGASDDELRRALADAQLLGWVDSLPDGLATPIGEHGARLSGGQRQRLALARALLADVRILVLDEPTEHLDEPTALAFIGDLDAVAGDRTVVVMTHRPELFPAATWRRVADLAPLPVPRVVDLGPGPVGRP